jgi:hypothetical protein
VTHRHRIQKKIIGNEDDWKMTQEQTTYTMDRPSKERCREERRG